VVSGGEAEALPTAEEWAGIKREASARSEAAGAEAAIPAALLQEVIDALRAGVPNEACGVLVSSRYWTEGGAAERWIPMRNAAESPYRYLIDAQEQLKVWMELDDADQVVWAIVHSHVASPAQPSQTDVGLASYPDSLYVIASLSDSDHPDVRAWTIVDGAVSEVALLVTHSLHETDDDDLLYGPDGLPR
jgi:proteasome lid subunit RPN8/RPN11